jgi:hypothetical protein
MRVEIVITKYTLIDLALVEAVAVIVAPSVLAISESVREAIVERVPL